MRYEITETTSLQPEQVWARLVDVEGWPGFIQTYRSVRRLDSVPLAVGSRVHIVQVGLRPGDWQVTALDDGHSFTWQTKQPGLLMVAWHRIDRDEDGACRLTLGVEISGGLGGIVGKLFGGKTRRYLDVEIAAFTASGDTTAPEQ
jgi:hypothetical protein